jgi:hypothetical protein
VLIIACIFAACVLGLCVWVVRRFWDATLASGCLPENSRLRLWAAKGMVVPLLLWISLNFALIPGHIATMPGSNVSRATSADWERIALALLFPSLPLAASCWAAFTLGWLLVHLVVKTEGRKEIAGAAFFWVPFLSPALFLVSYFFGWMGVGVCGMVLFIPLLKDLLALGQPKRLPPAYERAIERLKSGDYPAAELEIIRQLEKQEDDFEGWMMLAGIYALNLGDLPEAERTVRELCRHPGITRTQYSHALMQLGEWTLQSTGNADAAANIWSELEKTFPHSEHADKARRRIAALNPVPPGSIDLTSTVRRTGC